ncbi:VWA domain-containing protein [Porphyromonas circumdentaria]|uniref:Ca-activated chloride channel family protein n=1 Tax=Porphyromonas circumdentaria TaxID=29524 RepID=A0A1T4LFM3_9PORP|nr:VWA domain-containing protein [Porphyromonas circumdentaria]MBB6275277.1 Ca-activated chloride channel family protein [Porphyromonas circumdentaria]SJZ53416.1 Ca-activated chloride channel family protein [Porphyromonas circumdentaria]
MYFAAPEYLWLLLLFLLLLGVEVMDKYIRKRQQQRYAERAFWALVKPDASVKRIWVRHLLLLLSITSTIMMLARPQQIEKSEKPLEERGIEAIIALDISNSMLAEDIAPNRLSFAKTSCVKLADKLNKSKIGLIVFAGSAYTQLPLTSDLSMIKSFIQDADTEIISNQGTAIGSAIDIAIPSFSSRKDVGKAIIILTDGETHDTNALEMAQKAASQGIKVYVSAIGSSEGASIPLPKANEYILDETGEQVITKANFKMCQELATAGEGAFVQGSNASALASKIHEELKKLPQAVVTNYTENKHELFGWFAFAALLFLVIMEVILPRKNRFFGRIKLFN